MALQFTAVTQLKTTRMRKIRTETANLPELHMLKTISFTSDGKNKRAHNNDAAAGFYT
jgi:hypothetical protein